MGKIIDARLDRRQNNFVLILPYRFVSIFKRGIINNFLILIGEALITTINDMDRVGAYFFSFIS